MRVARLYRCSALTAAVLPTRLALWNSPGSLATFPSHLISVAHHPHSTPRPVCVAFENVWLERIQLLISSNKSHHQAHKKSRSPPDIRAKEHEAFELAASTGNAGATCSTGALCRWHTSRASTAIAPRGLFSRARDANVLYRRAAHKTEHYFKLAPKSPEDANHSTVCTNKIERQHKQET